MLEDLNGTGVYEIRNTITDRHYIGSASRGFRKRWRAHTRRLRSGLHSCPLMQEDWDRFGEDSFQFNVLVVCDPGRCVEEEQLAIDTRLPTYNVCRVSGNCLGVRHGETTKEKHRSALLGKRLGDKHPMFGKHHSEASKAKASAALKGRPKSETTKARMRASQPKGAGRFRGRRHSEESRKRIGESLARAYSEGRHRITLPRTIDA